MKKIEASSEEYAEAMKGIEAAAIDEAELERLRASAKPPVVIDLRGRSPDESYEGAISIPMIDLVEEVVRKAIPSFETTIVLVCNQSFELTRMVALSSYAYPTLKLMGYTDVKILRTWSLETSVGPRSA
jgi:rhodanese-related sulfurtransferase